MAKKQKLKIIPLGGLDEIGKNMTAIEYGNEIILVDCGMSFPDDDMLGVDLVLPDFTYAIRQKESLRGIVITHGHEDHIGALPYFLKEVDVPVYATKLTIGLIENKLKQQLQKMNIPAEMLPQMNAYDFSDVLYNYYYSAETAPKAYMFLGARRSFIKDFIRKNEKKFRQFLKHLDIDDRYSDELISNMKKYGKTSRVYVIDHKKGAELLKTYQEKGIIPPDENIGDKLT